MFGRSVNNAPNPAREEPVVQIPRAGDKLRNLNFDNETLLVTGFVGLSIFVLLEGTFFAVVPVARVVVLSFAHTLLVLLGFGIILLVVGMKGNSAETDGEGGGEHPVFQVHFHA